MGEKRHVDESDLMEQNANARISRKMLMVGLILFTLAELGEMTAFVMSFLQDDRWPFVPTIVLLVLTPMIFSVSRKIRSRK